MKVLLTIGLLLALNVMLTGQILDSDTITITNHKTTSLIFPYPITTVDRGLAEVLVQKAKGTENILFLKASKPNLPETNLTVITADGILKELTVTYSTSPTRRTYSFGASMKTEAKFNSGTNARQLKVDAKHIVSIKRDINLHDNLRKISLRVEGIYAKDNLLFFRIRFKNRSNTNYNTQSLRFFLKDDKQLRRTVAQESEITPLYIYNSIGRVKANSSLKSVCAFPSFNIPPGKKLVVEISEENGSRSLSVNIPSQFITNAILIK